MFKEITIKNLLSFGPETNSFPLENLTVLIGPNGSGKSNFLETLRLLRGCPHRDSHLGIQSVLSDGGGVNEWIWKGDPNGMAAIECVFNPPSEKQDIGLRHSVSIGSKGHTFLIKDERLESEKPFGVHESPYLYYGLQGGSPVINTKDANDARKLKPETVVPNLSILAQIQDPHSYPELATVTKLYEQVRLYREWEFGRNTVFRIPQKADLRTDRLEEDFSNLGLVLNRLRSDPYAKDNLLTHLKYLYDGISDFDVSIKGGSVQVYFTEKRFVIPATRLSDGSMRFLCLLALLCDPDPPPFLGIEEPELGLHPDVLPKLADLLIEASTRTQLVVTTHSDILVDALSECPSSVVVCEKTEGQTTLRRLDPDEVSPWLTQYRLGELWNRGNIGGNRW